MFVLGANWTITRAKVDVYVPFSFPQSHAHLSAPTSLVTLRFVLLPKGPSILVGRGEKAPTLLVRKQAVLLRADFVLTKDLNWPYEAFFMVKLTGKGLVVEQSGALSKDENRP